MRNAIKSMIELHRNGNNGGVALRKLQAFAKQSKARRIALTNLLKLGDEDRVPRAFEKWRRAAIVEPKVVQSKPRE